RFVVRGWLALPGSSRITSPWQPSVSVAAQPTCTIAVFGEGSSTGRDGRTIPIGAVSELSSSPRPFGSPAEPSPVGEPPVPTPGRPSPVSPPDGTDVSALTFTCSQLELTVSCESDTTVSSPSPQSIW